MKSYKLTIERESMSFSEIDDTRSRNPRERDCFVYNGTYDPNVRPKSDTHILGDRAPRVFSDDYVPGPCLEPTHHLPGSRGKIMTLINRASTGQEFWHKDDNLGMDVDDEPPKWESEDDDDFEDYLSTLEGLR